MLNLKIFNIIQILRLQLFKNIYNLIHCILYKNSFIKKILFFFSLFFLQNYIYQIINPSSTILQKLNLSNTNIHLQLSSLIVFHFNHSTTKIITRHYEYLSTANELPHYLANPSRFLPGSADKWI